MVFRLPFPAFCQTASTTGLAWPTKRRPGGTSGSTASRSWRTDPTHTGTRGSPPGIRSTVFRYKDTFSGFCSKKRGILCHSSTAASSATTCRVILRMTAPEMTTTPCARRTTNKKIASCRASGARGFRKRARNVPRIPVPLFATMSTKHRNKTQNSNWLHRYVTPWKRRRLSSLLERNLRENFPTLRMSRDEGTWGAGDTQPQYMSSFWHLLLFDELFSYRSAHFSSFKRPLDQLTIFHYTNIYKDIYNKKQKFNTRQ